MQLMPRYLVDVSRRDLSATVFGRRYSLPFGSPDRSRRPASPERGDGAGRGRDGGGPAADPLGASVASIEAVAKAAPRHTWLHLYAARNPAISEDQIRRAQGVGIETLVLTVDNPVYPGANVSSAAVSSSRSA